MLVKLVTPKGYEFWGESLVTIGGVDYALNEMTEPQQDFVLAHVDAQALNAVYAGRATFSPDGQPSFEAVFPEQAARMGRAEIP